MASRRKIAGRWRPEDERPRCPRESYILQMLASRNRLERNSLYIGIHENRSCLAILPRTALHEHMHILGATGSGKSSRAIMPIISQLLGLLGLNIYLAEEQWAKGEQPHPLDLPFSILGIDCKGDKAGFNGVKDDVERRCGGRVPLKWLTNVPGLSTFAFDALGQLWDLGLTVNQVVQILIEDFELRHGPGYGRGYFEGVNEIVLREIFDLSGPVRTFVELYGHYCELRDGHEIAGRRSTVNRKLVADAGELASKLAMLASIAVLNPSEQRDGKEVMQHAINLPQMLETPQVVWFHLPATLEPAAVREIGKLALFVLRTAASLRHAKETPGLQLYLATDEFQCLSGPALKSIIQQARSMNIGLILANQSLSDLKEAAYDLIPCLESNVRVRQLFSATDELDRRNLISSSGETIDFITSWSEQEDREPVVRDTEHIVPRITPNDVIRVSDNEELSILHVPRGQGYARLGGFPNVIRSPHHVPRQVYLELTTRPLPEPSPEYPGAYVPGQHRAERPSTPPASTQLRAEAPDPETEGAMRRLMDQQKARREKQRKRSKNRRKKPGSNNHKKNS